MADGITIEEKAAWLRDKLRYYVGPSAVEVFDEVLGAQKTTPPLGDDICTCGHMRKHHDSLGCLAGRSVRGACECSRFRMPL